MAQNPYNLAAPVTNLATLFTDLFGPRGLIVDSLATLPGEQPHSAHFTSNFQFNFNQFSTALVSQLVSVPAAVTGWRLHLSVRSVARRVSTNDSEFWSHPGRARRDDWGSACLVWFRVSTFQVRFH